MKSLRIDSKRKLVLVISLIFVFGFVLGALVMRYLFSLEETPEYLLTDEADPSAAAGLSSTPVPSSAAWDTTPYSDDLNFRNANVCISIQKVYDEATLCTYYVADVRLASADVIKAVFAQDKFGRNFREETSQMAARAGAVFAVNGDYYGFHGHGIIIRNGLLYRDVAYTNGMAILSDGTMEVYDETETSGEALLQQGAVQSYCFGPILVKDGVVQDVSGTGIGGLNPRTGVGMIAPLHYIFIVVDGRQEGYSEGITLESFAELFVRYGCVTAYNLDGGGSSTMYLNGKIVNQPSGASERSVSDALCIMAEPQ